MAPEGPAPASAWASLDWGQNSKGWGGCGASSWKEGQTGSGTPLGGHKRGQGLGHWAGLGRGSLGTQAKSKVGGGDGVKDRLPSSRS